MPGHEKDKKHRDYQKESKEESSINHGKDGLTINITINIGNIHIEQRAEGGGQINKDVGTNANQGGQNAIDHSQSENNQSQFADGNGRSGIAGSDNDEAGGQQGIKVRDSELIKSKIKSASGQIDVHEEEPDEESGEAPNVEENE
jgi:hypothetical protein